MDPGLDDSAKKDQLVLKGDHHLQRDGTFGVARYSPFASRLALIDHSPIEPGSHVIKWELARVPYFGLDHFEQSMVGVRQRGVAGREFDL
jgi:hypothetical protein